MKPGERAPRVAAILLSSGNRDQRKESEEAKVVESENRDWEKGMERVAAGVAVAVAGRLWLAVGVAGAVAVRVAGAVLGGLSLGRGERVQGRVGRSAGITHERPHETSPTTESEIPYEFPPPSVTYDDDGNDATEKKLFFTTIELGPERT
jgi:hypothetical protein